MTRSISVKDTAKMLRDGLKNEFPGVKFSVTMGRGTAATWLYIRYTDGPTETAVRQLAFRYQGAQFNGMTDSYDPVESRLIAFDDEWLPEEVHFQVEGINETRTYSAAAWIHAQQLIESAGYPEIRVSTPSGVPINDGPLPENVTVDGRHYGNLYSPAGLARSVLYTQDLRSSTINA
jgi:hypothetical protein